MDQRQRPDLPVVRRRRRRVGSHEGHVHPGPGHKGKTVIVKVTGKKAGYTTAAKSSRATVAVAAPSTLTAATPTISGTPKVGLTLTAKPGTWTSGTAFTFQWYVSGAAVSGATTITFTPTAAHRGKTVTVKVTGKKAGYTTLAKTSPATVAVAAPSTLTAATPTISGTPKVGLTLTAKPGTWTSGTAFAYQWYVSGAAVSGATKVTFTPASTHKGKTVTVKVTGSKAGYAMAAKTSRATATVAAGTLVAATPTISGTAKVGLTLTATPGTWTSGTAFTYQWYAAGTAVSGATNVTFLPSSAHQGKTVTVKVTGSKAGYTTAARTSAATVAVVGAVDGPAALTGTLENDTTWTAAQTPLVIIRGTLTVPADIHLRIEPGVVVKFASVDGNAAELVVLGDLTVAGTAAQPVVMTSISDDTVAGDSNGDGSATAPGWGEFNVNASAGVTITHLEQRWSNALFVNPVTANSSTTITDSRLSGGVQWESRSSVASSAHLTFERNTIDDAHVSIFAVYGAELTVRDNTFEPRFDGDEVLYLVWGGLLPSHITGNTATRPAIARFGGNLLEDWDVPDSGNLSWGSGQLGTSADTTITVAPGTTFYGQGRLGARHVVALGTPADPIVFKGMYDYTTNFCLSAGSVTMAHVVFDTKCDTFYVPDARDDTSIDVGADSTITDSTIGGNVFFQGQAITRSETRSTERSRSTPMTRTSPTTSSTQRPARVPFW